jgi:hypothetical protein
MRESSDTNGVTRVIGRRHRSWGSVVAVGSASHECSSVRRKSTLWDMPLRTALRASGTIALAQYTDVRMQYPCRLAHRRRNHGLGADTLDRKSCTPDGTRTVSTIAVHANPVRAYPVQNRRGSPRLQRIPDRTAADCGLFSKIAWGWQAPPAVVVDQSRRPASYRSESL